MAGQSSDEALARQLQVCELAQLTFGSHIIHLHVMATREAYHSLQE